MELRPVTLPLAGDRTTFGMPRSKTMAAILVLAHGANNDMDYPLIAGLHEKLARQGLVAVRSTSPTPKTGGNGPIRTQSWRGFTVWCWSTWRNWKSSRVWTLPGWKIHGGPAWPRNWWPGRWGPAAWSFWAIPCTRPASRRICGTSRYISCPVPAPFIEGAQGPLLPPGPAGGSAGPYAGAERCARHPQGGALL